MEGFIKSATTVEFKKILGVFPDPLDGRDYLVTADKNPSLVVENNTIKLEVKQDSLPAEFSLQKFMPSIEDQQGTPECSAFMASGLLEYFNYKDVKEFVDFAEDWIYNKARTISRVREDILGVDIRSVLKVLNQEGALPKREWSALLKKPKKQGKELEDILSNYKIKTYASVLPKSEDNIKRSLINFGPICVGIRVYENWRWVGNSGRLEEKDIGVFLGYHAVLLVGYIPGYFIIRNSWGDWGKDGYAYISIDYFIKNVFSLWTSVDILGSKDLYDPTKWELFVKGLPKGLKKAFGIPF